MDIPTIDNKNSVIKDTHVVYNAKGFAKLIERFVQISCNIIQEIYASKYNFSIGN